MLADEIAEYLQTWSLGNYDSDAEVVGGATEFAIYVGFMPDAPDRAVGIRQTGELKRDMRLKEYTYPTVEVLVRGTTDPRVAEGQAQEICTQMHGLAGVEFVGGGAYIVKCQAINGPNDLGPDENGRHNYSINFDLITI
jgi:hypothetical protein